MIILIFIQVTFLFSCLSLEVKTSYGGLHSFSKLFSCPLIQVDFIGRLKYINSYLCLNLLDQTINIIKFKSQLFPMDADEYYEDPEQSMQQEEYVEEEPTASLICDSCGYENDIYNSTCLVCEKDLYAQEENIQNQSACYICGMLVPISEYQQHSSKCQFQRKVEILMGKKIDESFLIKRSENHKKIKKSDTKKCMYCSNPYLLTHLHEHQLQCPKRPQPQKSLEVDPKIESIQFDITKVLPEPEIERLTATQCKAITYMHKKAIFYHNQAVSDFNYRMKKLGYEKEEIKLFYEYLEHKAPFLIHVNLQRYVDFFLEDTNYRNLFETDSSSGTTNKISRKNKEDKIFNNIFFDAQHFQRVKYGAVNVTNDPEGINVAKGYGKSYFVLKPVVRNRCTITHCNSFSCQTNEFGTTRHLSHVLNKFTDKEIEMSMVAAKGGEASSKVLKSYKEIQIIGPVEFSKDVEYLCIDINELKGESLDKIISFIRLYGVEYKVFGNDQSN